MTERRLEDYLADLNALSSQGSRGSVFTVSSVGTPVKLFEYILAADNETITITPTKQGMSLFKGGIFREVPLTIHCDDQSPQLLSQLFGVSYSSGQHNLESSTSAASIIDRAKSFGNYIVATSDRDAESILKRAVRINDDLIHDEKNIHESIFSSSGVKITNTVSSCYVRRGNSLTPVVVKRCSPDTDGKLDLLIEYACTKALRMAGLSAVETKLIRSNSGEFALVMDDFRARRFPVKELDGKVVTSGQHFFRRPSYFSANALLLKSNQPPSQTNITENACLVAAGAIPERSGLLAQHAFNMLIGNTDMHGDNCGVFREFDGEGNVTASQAPSFDVGTHLFSSPIGENAHDRYLNGKVLDNLGPSDVAKSVSSVRLRATSSQHDYLSAFAQATVAREFLMQVLKEELPAQGVISKNEVSRIEEYFTRPLGTVDSKLSLVAGLDVNLRRNPSFI